MESIFNKAREIVAVLSESAMSTSCRARRDNAMSKWFSITIVVLIVFWLSLLSLTQYRLATAMHKYNVIIMEHESDLARIKMRMLPPRIQARPTPQVAPSAPSLPRQRRRLVADTSEFGSPRIEFTAAPRCW